ncbi:MAG: hypothetical protein U1C73_21345, partial [Dietzia sp.]|nr:hypothetical protein [Dietzia sp.]
TPSATCATCHTATPTTVATDHINGTLTTSWNVAPPSINFDSAVGFADAATPSCGPNGALVNCHDDKGAWKRWWSATADDNTVAECDNCHGMFKAAADSWVAGISQRHTGPDNPTGDIEANHDMGGGPCYQCHSYGDTSAYYSPTVAWANHRDGSVQLNNQNTFVDEGATGTVRCDGCHSTPYGLLVDQHSFQDTLTGDSQGIDRWGRAMIPGPVGDCNSCHTSVITAASGAAPHAGVNESLANHDTTHALASAYIVNCGDCHTNNGPGTGTLHNDGTVNFKTPASGGRLDSTLDYARTVTFPNTDCNSVNGCHNSDPGEWAANNLGADACVDCHRAVPTKVIGAATGVTPTSGLHAMTALNVTNHDETLTDANATNGVGCTECHAELAVDPATHKNGTAQADAASNTESRFITRLNLTFSDLAPNAATCSGTGLPAAGCHSDGGNWSRLWSTDANTDYIAGPNPAQLVCNVCHGQFSTLLNSSGWRAGTSHFRAGAVGATEDKGV